MRKDVIIATLLIILPILLSVSFFCEMAFASTWTDPEIGIVWTYNIHSGEDYTRYGWCYHPDGAYIGSWTENKTAIPTSTVGHVSIPLTLGGQPVVGIEPLAFDFCDGLTSVTISAHIENIFGEGERSSLAVGKNPFAHCSNLQSITVSNCCEHVSIDGVLFERGCDRPPDEFKLLSYPRAKKGPYSIPEFVRHGGEKITAIDMAAFSGCGGLTSLTIPAGLEELYLPWCSFVGCTNLCSFVVATNNPIFASSEGIIFDKTLKHLFRYPSGKAGAYLIPNHVESVVAGAFADCSNLKSITIPNTVTNIGEAAFWKCDVHNSIDFEGLPPIGLYRAIKKDTAIRYNVKHKTEWLSVVAECGFTNAKPYTPKSKCDKGMLLFLAANNHSQIGQ